MNSLNFDLAIARSKLVAERVLPLFTKWYIGALLESALGNYGGGAESPIFSVKPNGYANCLAPDRSRATGSISYVEDTGQYLQLFVCLSPSEPATTKDPGPGQKGAAWFFSTIVIDHVVRPQAQSSDDFGICFLYERVHGCYYSEWPTVFLARFHYYDERVR